MNESNHARHDFPYPSRYVEVKGAKMHYVEAGEGDPILFLHGQPTWSYLWRNIMPGLERNGRVIALDLIGYGLSDRPAIAYEMTDHIAYVEGFIEALGLRNVTLVVHDWGSYFGFHYAARHQANVKGVAFMEAMLLPLPGYHAFEPEMREFFTALRSSQEIAEDMMVNQNLFIEVVLPAAIKRKLTDDEWNAYREPFAKPEDRRILCKFPQNLVIGGEPKANYDTQMAYVEALRRSPVPKLMITASPGILIDEAVARWAREELPNLTSVHVGDGLHYIQEDHPAAIANAISAWMSAT